MSRLGWIIGALILAAAALFGSMLTIGGVRQRAASVARVPAAVADVPGLLHVPVAGVARSALRDSWGEAREGGARGHHGTDIPAAGGTPVTAAGAGRVEKIFTSARGGLTLYQRSADGNWLYYYAHLSGYAPGIREGQELRAGDPVGFVGDTGDAGAGNTHLHFGLTRIGPGEHWWQGRDIDPFPALSGRQAGVAAGSATG